MTPLNEAHIRPVWGLGVAINTPKPSSIEFYSLAWRALLVVTGSPSIPHTGRSGWLIQQPINDKIRRRWLVVVGVVRGGQSDKANGPFFHLIQSCPRSTSQLRWVIGYIWRPKYRKVPFVVDEYRRRKHYNENTLPHELFRVATTGEL